MTTTVRLPDLPRPRRSTILWGMVLCNVQALFVLVYVAIIDRPLLDPFLFYPWIWINVGLWALFRIDPPAASSRRLWGARAIGVGYFGLLALVGNMIGPGERLGGNPADGLSVRIFDQPPGWGPALIYNGDLVHVSLLPLYVVGFLALSYLVYVTALEATSLASVGLLGLFSCVTCTLPILVAFATAVFGGSVSVILAVSSSFVYVAGTTLYVLTVGLLSWRLGVD